MVARKKPSPKERIERLEVYLIEILAGTIVPNWEKFPRRLSGIREYSSPRHGVVPIGSPNDFTTTHPHNGEAVKRIAKLLKDIAKINPEAGTGKAEPADVETSRETDGFPDRNALLAQWHEARQKADDAEHLQGDVDRYLVMISSKDAIIKQLRSEIENLKRPKFTIVRNDE